MSGERKLALSILECQKLFVKSFSQFFLDFGMSFEKCIENFTVHPLDIESLSLLLRKALPQCMLWFRYFLGTPKGESS